MQVNNKPLVSVICTVKNGMETLSATLDSLLAQTLTEWELIVIDDGSTDSTPTILAEYAQRDKRIRPVFTTGIGRAKALNLAISYAKANLIANIDADDPCHPHRLQIQLQVMREYPEYAVLGTHTTILYGNESPYWNGLTDESYNNCQPLVATSLLPYRNPINHSSVMMRLEPLQRVKSYDEQRTSQLDYDLWVRLAGSGERIGNIPLQLSSKRLHVNQSFENKHRIKYLCSSILVQASAIRAMKPEISAWIILVIRFVWGLIPTYFRNCVRKFYQPRSL